MRSAMTRTVVAGRTDREDGELVAAQASHDVVLSGGPGAGDGHTADQFVPGLVAELVVDRLEPVDVDREDREPVLPAALPPPIR